MKRYNFDDLKNIMDILTGENGCPWDQVQTHESISNELIEECYEVLDAIYNNDAGALCEELGDVCLHVVFHGKIAEKNNEFTTDDIIHNIAEKMVRRHSHVFGDVKAESPKESILNWDLEKQKEKGYSSKTDKLKRVPKAFPALLRAQKIQGLAEKAGAFEDEDLSYEEAFNKFLKMLEKKDIPTEEDLGELLFSVAKISRKFKLNAEIALTNDIEKFINRFEQEENAGNLR